MCVYVCVCMSVPITAKCRFWLLRMNELAFLVRYFLSQIYKLI